MNPVSTHTLRTAGFTLVELLISLALLGILLTAVVSINISTSQSSAALQTRNDLQTELQTTQNYMAGKMKEAAYVFPTGSNIQMASSGWTTRNSISGNYNWVVGTHPIVAFILPPRTVVAGTCSASTAADRCYAFYAFYAIKRSDYVASATGADNPGANPANDASAWMLMEYRGYYSSATLNTNIGYLQAVTAIPTGNSARLLMDYLPTYPAATPLFSVLNAGAAPSSQTAGVTTITMNLAAQQAVGGLTVRLPDSSATSFNTLTIYPRNVGKPTVSN